MLLLLLFLCRQREQSRTVHPVQDDRRWRCGRRGDGGREEAENGDCGTSHIVAIVHIRL